MKRFLTLTSALGFATIMGCAVAEDMPAFEDLDTDKDGMIGAIEASANDAVMEKFSALDTDEDGSLSPEEYAAASSES